MSYITFQRGRCNDTSLYVIVILLASQRARFLELLLLLFNCDYLELLMTMNTIYKNEITVVVDVCFRFFATTLWYAWEGVGTRCPIIWTNMTPVGVELNTGQPKEPVWLTNLGLLTCKVPRCITTGKNSGKNMQRLCAEH